jgi:hypothetical protein
MSIEQEFDTVDLILASKAPTRGVDAFALSLIKAERQIRRLFTHLIYQFPAFGSAEIPALRNVLEANRRVYFGGFLDGYDALYPRPAAALVGVDYPWLRERVNEAIEHRNKIFHGQLTSRLLSRDDLLSLADDIRSWCSALAAGASAELGYDGFARNSFRKSAVPDLWLRYRVQFATVADYENFIRANMQRP